MKIGDNEKIVLAILQEHKKITLDDLHVLFFHATHRRARLDKILSSLIMKDFIEKDKKTKYFIIVDNNNLTKINLPKIKIEKEIVANLSFLRNNIKLGNVAKTILYILRKTEKCSLPFLTNILQSNYRNVYSILRRLENKNMIYSYQSRIRHKNKIGRKYNPIYYIPTKIGVLWFETFADESDYKNIDILLDSTQKEVDRLNSSFWNKKT